MPSWGVGLSIVKHGCNMKMVLQIPWYFFLKTVQKQLLHYGNEAFGGSSYDSRSLECSCSPNFALFKEKAMTNWKGYSEGYVMGCVGILKGFEQT